MPVRTRKCSLCKLLCDDGLQCGERCLLRYEIHVRDGKEWRRLAHSTCVNEKHSSPATPSLVLQCLLIYQLCSVSWGRNNAFVRAGGNEGNPESVIISKNKKGGMH